MKLLLDTHIALWAFIAPEKLPEEIVTALKSAENTVYYSMASVWEVAIKHKIRPEEMLVSEEVFVTHDSLIPYYNEKCVMSV